MLKRFFVFNIVWLVLWLAVICFLSYISPKEGNLHLPLLGGIIIVLGIVSWVIGAYFATTWQSSDKSFGNEPPRKTDNDSP